MGISLKFGTLTRDKLLNNPLVFCPLRNFNFSKDFEKDIILPFLAFTTFWIFTFCIFSTL